MNSREYLNYRTGSRKYAKKELEFDDDYEFALYKYSHHLSLSCKDFWNLKNKEIACSSHKTWKKYINKKYRKKKTVGYTQNLVMYANFKREESKVFEELFSGVYLVMLASLLLQLVMEIFEPIKSIEWQIYPVKVRLIALIVCVFVLFIIASAFLLLITYALIKEMKERRCRKLFYASLINALGE